MRIVSLGLVALALAIGTACTDGELPSESELDRLRILAARATPAEVAPGALVQLESLTFRPGSGPVGVVWELCTSMECPSVERRSDPASLLDEGELDPQAGLIGLEPELPPMFAAPPGVLDALPASEQEEGTFVRFGLSAVAWPDGDTEEVEWATKDLPVSASSTPNTNPVLSTVRVGVEDAVSGDALLLAAREHELEVVGLDAMAESYTYRTTDGTVETREETIDVRWYSDLGSFDGSFWDPGPSGGSGSLIVVVRDGRGGTDWAVLQVEIE